MTMDYEDKKKIKKLQLENGVKDEKKVVRQFQKQCQTEFLEENDYSLVDTNQLSSECNEALQEFDPAIHDAWIVQCPKGVDINALAGKRIKMPGRRYVGDIQVRTTHYERPQANSIGYANNKGKYAVRLLPLAGHVIVSKRLNMDKPDGDGESNEYPKPSVPQKFRLPVRHPFFGRDYKARIDVDKKTAKKLRNADKNCAEVKEKLHSTGNFYKIRQKLLATTQTLEQKEHDVRQSVLTGVAPKFLQNSEHPDYIKLLDSSDEEQKEKKPKKKSSKRKMNGSVDIKTESCDENEEQTPKKKKSLQTDEIQIQKSGKKKKA